MDVVAASQPVLLRKSLPRSDAAQKNGGDSAPPICRADGTTISTGFPLWCGSTYAKFHYSPSLYTILQKLSFMSSLLNMMSPPSM